MSEEVQLKTYKVLKQLGWKGGTYAEGNTVEMEPKFAEYYINEKVLQEGSDRARDEAPPAPAKIQSSPTTSTTTTPITEPEAS